MDIVLPFVPTVESFIILKVYVQDIFLTLSDRADKKNIASYLSYARSGLTHFSKYDR